MFFPPACPAADSGLYLYIWLARTQCPQGVCLNSQAKTFCPPLYLSFTFLLWMNVSFPSYCQSYGARTRGTKVTDRVANLQAVPGDLPLLQ